MQFMQCQDWAGFLSNTLPGLPVNELALRAVFSASYRLETNERFLACEIILLMAPPNPTEHLCFSLITPKIPS